MRIASLTLTDGLVRQIQNLSNQQARLQTQVATGQRIEQPDDDPAAANRVLGYQSQQRQLGQFASNANRALEISQSSYSGLSEIKKLSDRATEIGTLGQGAASADARAAYAAEVNQLLEQAVQLANGKLGNDYLYAGTAVDTAPFVATRDADGRITGTTYAGNAESAAIPLSSTSSIAPGTDPATNLGLRDFMNQLAALRDALEADDSAALKTAQADLLATEDVLVSSLAGHGAVQMRIEVSQSQQQSLQENLENLVSAETSTDLATTLVRLSQSQTSYQAALQSTSMIMRTSLLDYLG